MEGPGCLAQLCVSSFGKPVSWAACTVTLARLKMPPNSKQPMDLPIDQIAKHGHALMRARSARLRDAATAHDTVDPGLAILSGREIGNHDHPGQGNTTAWTRCF